MPFCSSLFNWNVVSKKALERKLAKRVSNWGGRVRGETVWHGKRNACAHKIGWVVANCHDSNIGWPGFFASLLATFIPSLDAFLFVKWVRESPAG